MIRGTLGFLLELTVMPQEHKPNMQEKLDCSLSNGNSSWTMSTSLGRYAAFARMENYK